MTADDEEEDEDELHDDFAGAMTRVIQVSLE